MRTIVSILLAAGLAGAQDQPRQQPGEDLVISTTSRFVIAPVTATDKNGKNVTGLTPLDFRLYDNGKLQVITEDVATHPISLAVAIQASHDTEQILPQIQKTASLYDSLILGDTGEMAIIGFDHRIQVQTQGFTSEAPKIAEALKKLKPGSTQARLNDAAMEAINLLKARPNNRKKILLLISESRDVGSELHVRDVMTAAELNNIVIYSVNMSHLLTSLTTKAEPNRPSAIMPATRQLPGGNINTPTYDSQVNMGNWVPAVKEIFTATKAIFIQNPLEVYTKYSGGREYSFMSQRGLDQAISDIGEELHGQYLLTYNPNNHEGGFHEIVVQIALPDIKVRTRNGYWLAGAKAE
jgi:VWFA-related protein